MLVEGKTRNANMQWIRTMTSPLCTYKNVSRTKQQKMNAVRIMQRQGGERERQRQTGVLFNNAVNC